MVSEGRDGLQACVLLFYLYVNDVDASCVPCAVDAGCISVFEPFDMPYVTVNRGDRSGW